MKPVTQEDNISDGKLTQDQAHYSAILCELWNGYTRFLHVGMAAAGFTILTVGQYLSSFSEPIGQLSFFVKSAIVFAGIAGICFASCRWLCQVIMERQVYGPRSAAIDYFEATETRPPNALWYSPKVLHWFYVVNDKFKFAGAASLVLSWISIVIVLFRQVDLTAAANSL